MGTGVKNLLKKIYWIIKKICWLILPFHVRQHIAIWLGRQHWLPGYSWLAAAIISDQGEMDVNAFHRFLWSHHLGYATAYEKVNDFGSEHLTQTRLMLFEHLSTYLRQHGLNPETDIKSVFDVGCASGYLLRYMETDLFPSASVLDGIDIDDYAVRQGTAYLEQQESRIRLSCADMANLEALMGENSYDVILCAGVLMYLDQDEVTDIVRIMLHHAEKLVVIAGLAHPNMDNASLTRSTPRRSDGTLIHNIDAMVEQAEGTVLFRRWEGARMFGGYSVYFIFCSLDALTTC